MDRETKVSVIVSASQKKRGYVEGDLIECRVPWLVKSNRKFQIASGECETTTDWDAKYVFIVDENADIKENDWVTDSWDGFIQISSIISVWNRKKIIASHPKLEDTLSIAPDMLQVIAESNGKCKLTVYPIEGVHGELDYLTVDGSCIMASVEDDAPASEPKGIDTDAEPMEYVSEKSACENYARALFPDWANNDSLQFYAIAQMAFTAGVKYQKEQQNKQK